jgi:hypothetical protein
MGRDRNDICHLGMDILPLAPVYHRLGNATKNIAAIHAMGDAAFMEKYHLEAVKVDAKIAKVYKLNTKEKTA